MIDRTLNIALVQKYQSWCRYRINDCDRHSLTNLWFLWQGLLAQGSLLRHWPKTNWWSCNPTQRATQALGYVRPLEAHTGTNLSGQPQGRPEGREERSMKWKRENALSQWRLLKFLGFRMVTWGVFYSNGIHLLLFYTFL